MARNKEFLIELIYKKLKNNNLRKIELEKNELNEFINYLINNNQ